jgi:toxin FitB
VIVLDTNVLSELMKPEPEPRVLEWADRHDPGLLFTTAISEAEMRYGAARMPGGRRRAALEAVIDRILNQVFAGRVLPFDSGAAQRYAEVAAARAASGRIVAPFDIQIAAVALARGAAVATRNTRDFAGYGVQVIDPWSAGAQP